MKKNMSLTLAISSLLACGGAFAGDNRNEKQVETHVEKHVTTEVQKESNASAMRNAESQGKAARAKDNERAKYERLSQDVRKAIGDWPQKQRDLVGEMVNKYGEPSGVMASRVVWDEPSNPWSEIIIYRDAVDHEFPVPHQDFLEQSVLYEVPADKMDELAKFDGSVIVYLTKGRLAARCDKEGANILALNLAHDVITGEKNVEQARSAYADAIKQMKQGREVALMQELNFEPMTAERAATTDEPVASL